MTRREIRGTSRTRAVSRGALSLALVTFAATLTWLVLAAPPAPAVTTPFAVLTAPGKGLGSLVHAFTRAGAPTSPDYFAYGPSWNGGVFVASGDVNGDGFPDSITGADSGGGPHVRVINGANGLDIYSFFAYAPGFTGGVRVASGDVNGDGFDDIITAAGPGGGPHVQVFSGANLSVLRSFFAYTPGFNGGVYVAAGDVTGDGLADIITGAGPGGGPHVKEFDGDTGNEVRGFFAYAPGFTGGVTVASGYVNGDLFADVITGAGPGGGPHVRIFDGVSLFEIRGFMAYPPAFTGGVYVSAADINVDEHVDVVTGAGAGGGPHVTAVDSNTGATLLSFFAYDPSFSGGVRVGGNPGTLPPLIEVTGGPDDGATVATPLPTYPGTASDSDGVVRNIFVSVDFASPTTEGVTCTGCNTASVTWSWSATTPLSQGPHHLIFYALDNSGLIATESRDLIVDLNAGPPSVTVDQDEAQEDPTKTEPIAYTATFSEPVNGFTAGDVVVGGTAGGTETVEITAVGTDRTTWTVEVSGMTTSGTVTASIPAGVATDDAGFLNTASTSTDNTVTWDVTPPTFTSIGSNGTTTVFANFSEPLDCTTVTASDFNAVVDGTPKQVTAAACTSPADDIIELTLEIAPSETVEITLTGNAQSVTDVVGNPATTPQTRSATVDTTAPTVTVNQKSTAPAQADPTNTPPINFTAIFSEAVTGFTGADVTIGGTAGATTATVTGGPTTYTIAITGMTASGTVTASIPAAAAKDLAGNNNAASTSTDNTVTWDVTDPTVTVNQAAAQADPTHTSPINFTVVFSETVTGFAAADVTISGTAGGTKTATVTGSGTTYNVAIALTGTITDGTVIVTVPADGATDAAGNGNAASTSTDNEVSWDTPPSVTVNQDATQADPTNGATQIKFTAVFSEPVTGFDETDVTIGGTAGGTAVVTVTGGPDTYTIGVDITAPTTGTVTASIGAGKAVDVASQPNTASTSTDNTVTVDLTAPSLGWVVVPATGSTITAVFEALNDPLLCSSVQIGDFTVTVAGMNRTISSVACTGTSDATIDLVLSSAPATGQTVAVLVKSTDTEFVLDRVGNKVGSDTVSGTKGAPTLAVTAGPADGSSTVDTTPTYSGTVSDGSSVENVQVSTDGGLNFSSNGVTLTCSGLLGCTLNPVTGFTYTPAAALPPGTYTFVFRSMDDEGNFSQPTVRTLTIT